MHAWFIVMVLASFSAVPGPPLPAPGSRFPAPGIYQDVLDRTLALVGGQPLTLSDARAALALGLIEPASGVDPLAGITARLIERELVLREVQRYSPPSPSESAVDARLDEVRKRFAGEAALTRTLDAHGFTIERLRAWIRDDLRSQAYLAQRFASASSPLDAEIAAAYTRSRTEFEKQGVSFEQATPLLRERLIAARRNELIADWLADLRRRTDVVIVQK